MKRTKTKTARRKPMFFRRRFCAFCKGKIDYLDYKDVEKLKRYVSERGKIVPRRASGNCAKHQRMVASAIKKARFIAFLPYTAE